MSNVTTEVDYCPMTVDTPGEAQSETRTLQMRVCLEGVLRNAAECIYALTSELCKRDGLTLNGKEMKVQPGQDMSEEEFEAVSVWVDRIQPLYYNPALDEIRLHVLGMKAGVHTKEEFERFYTLDETVSKSAYFRAWRLMRPLTHVQVSELTGLPSTTISRWERGEIQLSDAEIDRIFRAVGIIEPQGGAA